MPSRQERDAAKRAPGQSGAGGAAGAAAALANLNVNVNPLGDWSTQTEDHNALCHSLGGEILKQRAGAGDRDAQYSLGAWLTNEAGAGELDAAGRSPKADVGFHLHRTVSGRSPDREVLRCGHLTTEIQ